MTNYIGTDVYASLLGKVARLQEVQWRQTPKTTTSIAALAAAFGLGVAVCVLLPTRAHSADDETWRDTGAWVKPANGDAAEPMPAHKYEVKVYVQALNTAQFQNIEYDFEIRANDLEDARRRFVKDHMIGNNYVFLQHQRDSDRLFMYEEHMVLHTEIKQEKE